MKSRKNKNDWGNRVMRKGLVFGILVMLFMATIASVGVADEGKLLVSIEGYSPSLSPDFKKVAYLTEDLRAEQLWVINTDGRGLKKLDEWGWEQSWEHVSGTIEEWDPDGKEILYTIYNWEDETKDLWVVNSDGTGKKRIAEYVQKHSPVARWSPDGSKIAFGSRYYGEGICVVNSDGSNKTLITKYGILRYWSSDGKKIIFSTEDNLWEIDLDNGIFKNIYNGFGIISPDRSKITSRSFHGIWISNIDGSNLKQLKYYNPVMYPCWSPDSKRIAFIDEGIRHGVWVINSDGSNQKKVKELLYEDIQRIEPIGVKWLILWNRDGSKIAYNIKKNETINIYTINVGKPPPIGPPTSETPTKKEPEFEAITPTPIPTPTPLGFESIFAIAGLLVVAYLLRRRQ